MTPPGYDDKKAASLHRLVDEKGKELTEARHRKCPGHAAYLSLTWQWVDTDGNPIGQRNPDRAKDRNVQRPVASYVCVDFKKHGHRDAWASSSSKPKASDLSEEEREKAKAERKLIIDNNKAWDSAQVVRREWLADFAKRKTAPKGTTAFIAGALSDDYRVISAESRTDQMTLCDEWGLSMKPGLYGSRRVTVPSGTTEARALVIALVQILAGHEAAMDRMDWRRSGKTERHGRYLAFLKSAGYGLSDVETFALSTKTV